MRRWRPSLLYPHHFISTFRPPPAFIKDDTRIVLHFTLSVSPGSIHGAVLFVNSYSRPYSVLHWLQQETGQLLLHSITSPHSTHRQVLSSVCPSTFCLSLYLSVSKSVCLYLFFHLSIYLFGYFSVYICVCLSILSIYLAICIAFNLSVCRSLYLFLGMSVYLSVCQSVKYSAHLCIFMFFYFGICLCIYLGIFLSIYFVSVCLSI